MRHQNLACPCVTARERASASLSLGATMRQCGECTACCEGWVSAKELDMWAGQACKHRTESGCGIYEDRPQDPCRTFQCGWLNGTLPEDESFRPDKCGAILLTDRQQAGWTVWRAVPVGRSVPEETVSIIASLARDIDQPLVWSERTENFAAEPWKTSTFASGPEEFINALKWDFSDQDVWDLG